MLFSCLFQSYLYKRVLHLRCPVFPFSRSVFDEEGYPQNVRPVLSQLFSFFIVKVDEIKMFNQLPTAV